MSNPSVTLTPRQRKDYEQILAAIESLQRQRDVFVTAVTGLIRDPDDDTSYGVEYANGVLTVVAPPVPSADTGDRAGA